MNIMRTALILGSGVLAAGFIFTTLLPAQSDRAEAATNPYAGQPAAIAAGKTLYTAQCQSCHASFTSLQRGSADGEILLNIRNGIANTPMRPYPQLSTDQLWQIISYMRTLAPGATTVAPTATASANGDVANGKSVFESKGACASCHQFNGKGIAVGPDLTAFGAYRRPDSGGRSIIRTPLAEARREAAVVGVGEAAAVVGPRKPRSQPQPLTARFTKEHENLRTPLPSRWSTPLVPSIRSIALNSKI